MSVKRTWLGKAEAAAATGTMGFSEYLARPTRENAQGKALTDGPYEELDVAAYDSGTIVCNVTGGSADVSIEVAVGGVWATLYTKVSVADAAPMVTTFSDLTVSQLRVTWATAVGAPTITVAVALGC